MIRLRVTVGTFSRIGLASGFISGILPSELNVKRYAAVWAARLGGWYRDGVATDARQIVDLGGSHE